LFQIYETKGGQSTRKSLSQMMKVNFTCVS